MYDICLVFLMFYCYSIFGWMVECLSCSIKEKRIVLNRGFLIGNYCPIYGCGALYMYFFLNRYYNDPVVLFVMALVGTSLLEYLTSYLMEKIFKARWWDYSNEPFNLEGRVCLVNAILFGMLGMLFIYVLNPIFMDLIAKIPDYLLIIISIVLFVTFLTDVIITFTVMVKLKKGLTSLRKDSTYDMDKQIKEVISSNSFYLRKLFKSFPKVKFKLPSNENILKSINNYLDNLDSLRKERKKKLKKLKQELKESKK